MDRKIRSLWIKALESGRYRQARERLMRKKNKSYSYCCLGVLCRVGGAKFESDNGYPVLGDDDNECLNGRLSNSFLDRFGLLENSQNELVKLNDSDKASFKQIAKWIRKNVKITKKKK